MHPLPPLADSDEPLGVVQQAVDPVPDLTTYIGQKWTKLGGAAVVGDAIAEVKPTPIADGEYQEFQNGVIVYTNDYGAVYMSTPIFERWQANGYKKVGAPTEDMVHDDLPLLSEGHTRATFDQGLIVHNDGSSDVFVVERRAVQEYLRDCVEIPLNCRMQGLGNPVSEWEITPLWPVLVQRFSHGAIFYDDDRGVALWGRILDKFLENQTVLGAPTVAPTSFVLPDASYGTQAEFENGVIIATQTSDPVIVTGAVREAYYARNGGPTGWLGLPLADTITTTEGAQYNDFQHGMIVNRPLENFGPGTDGEGTEGTHVFGDLFFTLAKAFTWSDGIGSDETYVRYSVDTFEGSEDEHHAYSGVVCADENVILCQDGDVSNAHDAEIRPNISIPLGAANSHLNINMAVAAYDCDSTSSDELHGSWEESHWQGDLFGVASSTTHVDHNARSDFGITTQLPYDPNAPFTTSRWWSFENWHQDDITQAQFAEAFDDVEPGNGWFWHPYNTVYYEALIRNSAEGGNCFGMALQSIYAEHGKTPLFPEPIYQYFENTQGGEKLNQVPQSPAHLSLEHQINVKHIYQFGADMIEYYIRALAVTWDTQYPDHLLRDVNEALQNGQPMMIGLSSGFWEDGHAIRALEVKRYSCGDGSFECGMIDVADPNNPADDERYIRFDADGHLRYATGSGSISYDVGGLFGDRAYPIPYVGLLDHPPTTLYGIGALADLALLIFGGSGDAVQVSDHDNKTLFRTGLAHPPARWADLAPETSRIPNMTPIPYLNAGKGSQMIAAKGQGTSYTYDFSAKAGAPAGAPYQATFLSNNLSAIVGIPGTPNRIDRLRVDDINTTSRAVSLEIPVDSVAKDVQMTVASAVLGRFAELSHLHFVPGQRIALRPLNGGYGLAIHNEGPATTAALRINSGKRDAPVEVGIIAIPSGDSEVAYQLPKTSITITGTVDGQNGWLLAPVQVQLSAQDYSGTGVARIEHRHNDDAWTPFGCPTGGGSVCTADAYTYDFEGASALSFRAIDRDNNVELAQSTSFQIDSRRPEVSVTLAQPTYTRVDPLAVQALATDPVPGSGLAEENITLDGASVTNGTDVDMLWFALGQHTLVVNATDVAGWTATDSASFQLVATVESLKATIRELRARGEIDSNGIMNSLLFQADHNLGAFLNHLSAQAGKQVSQRAADLLRGDVNFILDHS